METLSETKITTVMRFVDAALSKAIESQCHPPEDPLYFFDVLESLKTKVFIGERERLRAALVKDERIEDGDGHHSALAAKAPSGFVWCVIDWGDQVTTMLRSRAGRGHLTSESTGGARE